jgi:hypothetical protein
MAIMIILRMDSSVLSMKGMEIPYPKPGAGGAA